MGKRGDRRRQRKKAIRSRKKVPYEGFRAGPLTVERYGRYVSFSMDRSHPEYEAFRAARRAELEAAPDAVAEARRNLVTRLAPYDAFDVLAALWLHNVPKNRETYKESSESGVLAICELAASVLVERDQRAGSDALSYFGPEALAEAQEHLHWMLGAKSLLVMFEGVDLEEGPSELDEIRAHARGHRLAVRGPSYEWQEEATVIELFDDPAIADVTHDSIGFDATTGLRLVGATSALGLERLDARLNEGREFARAAIAELHRARRGEEPADSKYAGVLERVSEMPLDDAEAWLKFAAVSWVGSASGTTLSFTVDELAAYAGVDRGQVARFLEMFSVGFNAFREIGRPVDVEDIRATPILRDEAGNFLCYSPHNLHWGVRPGIEAALKVRGQSSFERYERHRSRVVERRAVGAISAALRPDWRHSELQYEVTENGSTKRAELDALLRHDSVLVIVEVKGSSMRPSARRGAPRSFREWLVREVAGAARQARRARDALVGEGATGRIFDSTGRELDLDLEGIMHIFEIVVTLEDLSAVAPSTWMLADAGLLPSDPIPRLVSLHELDIICELSGRPAEFVHYLQRRQRMDATRRAWALDELDYFMHYVTRGLYWPLDPEDEGRPPEQLLSHTDDLDAYYMYKRGERQTPAKKPSRDPSEGRAGAA